MKGTAQRMLVKSELLTLHRFIQRLEHSGFAKERQIAFPHKQSWFLRVPRDTWEGPRFDSVIEEST